MNENEPFTTLYLDHPTSIQLDHCSMTAVLVKEYIIYLSEEGGL